MEAVAAMVILIIIVIAIITGALLGIKSNIECEIAVLNSRLDRMERDIDRIKWEKIKKGK